MPMCVIFGCSNRPGGKNNVPSDTKLTFYKLPTVRCHEDEATRKLSEERRRLWKAAINRKGIETEEAWDRKVVCSRHFVGGEKAYLHLQNSPSWLPTLHLGYDTSCAMTPADSADRYLRLQKRSQGKSKTSLPTTTKRRREESTTAEDQQHVGEDGETSTVDEGRPADLKGANHPDWIPTRNREQTAGRRGSADGRQRQALRRSARKELLMVPDVRASNFDSNSMMFDGIQALIDAHASLSNSRVGGDQGAGNITEQGNSARDGSVESKGIQCNFTGEEGEQAADRSVQEDKGVQCAVTVGNKCTQTDVTEKYISQLHDVLNHFTVENARLKEGLANKEQHNEAFYRRKEDRVRCYTGLPSLAALTDLVGEVSDILGETPRNSLCAFRQVTLTLIRLRLDLPAPVLEDMFGVSRATVSRVFHRVLDALYCHLQACVRWPDRDSIRKHAPADVVEHFGEKAATLIVDCFEVRFEHGKTMKTLIGLLPKGTVVFLSKAWEGKTSDRHIVEHCSFLDKMEAGDIVLASRGFADHGIGGLRHARVTIARDGKKHLSAFQVESSRRVTSIRIHIEHLVGSLRKTYTVLDSVMPFAFMYSDHDVRVLDKVVFVCCALTNNTSSSSSSSSSSASA